MCARPRPFAAKRSLPLPIQRLLHQVQYMLELAVIDDEAGRLSEADKLYMSAVDLALKAVSPLSPALAPRSPLLPPSS